jgi:exodeoxyribonuclease VII large subunit
VFEPAPSAPARQIWGVAALLQAATDALSSRFGALAVKGELAGFSRAASGHCYFTLKDADGAPALLRCAMFRRAASMLDFAPADGQQVELRGRIGVYESRGELQVVVESLQRLGAGALYEEFLRRRARLALLGLFDPARKRPLPPHPRALGVVTSLAAAALRDVLSTLQRRAPHVQVVIYPTLVQGAEAPPALVEALRVAGERRDVDVVLLVRGGGSMEDLWAFNDERVVKAVAACALPVICGVGHETDVTLCDLGADLRAPTPTAAAELAAPARSELLDQLLQLQRRLQRAVERTVQIRAQGLDHLAQRLGRPSASLLGQGARLGDLQRRLQLAAGQRITRQAEALPIRAHRLSRAVLSQFRQHRQVLDGTGLRLQAQDPHRVLQRGYAWVEAADGQPIVSVRRLLPGQPVRAVWADGQADAVIQRIESLPPSGGVGLPTI